MMLGSVCGDSGGDGLWWREAEERVKLKQRRRERRAKEREVDIEMNVGLQA